METKICTKCGEELTIDMFCKLKSSKDGVRTACKKCAKQYRKDNATHIKQWYEDNKEEILGKQKQKYLESHPIHPKEVIPKGYKRCCKCNKLLTLKHFGKLSKSKDGFKYECKICKKNYHQANIIQISKQRKEYYKNNKDMLLEKQSVYRTSHIEEHISRHELYYEKNKIKVKENVRVYRLERSKTDVNFKLINYYRTRIYKALKDIDKSKKTIELIGCSIDNFKEHLEMQFTEGMTWDNYGEWHVDHIMPCASFDFNNGEEQIKCFNYMNLQPLWKEDNFKKHDKII